MCMYEVKIQGYQLKYCYKSVKYGFITGIVYLLIILYVLVQTSMSFFSVIFILRE